MQTNTMRMPKALAQVGENPCEVAGLFHLLAGRWVLPVLYHLHHADAPMRFGQLRRVVGEVTPTELTKTLRLLETTDLITRRIYPEVPVRVEYECTDMGNSLKKPINLLADWLKTHGAKLQRKLR